MKKEQLQNISTEKLKKKEQDTKILIGFFLPIVLTLFYFIISDFVSSNTTDMISLAVVICSLGGMVSLFLGLKSIRGELKNRN